MSKRNLKRILCGILSAALLIGLIGCGPQIGDKETTKAPEQTKAPDEGKTDAPTDAPTQGGDEVAEITYPLDTDVKLKWWSVGELKHESAFNSPEECPFHVGLEKNTGVDIEWEFSPQGVDDNQGYSLMITEDKLPHLIHFWSTAAQAEELIQEDLIYDLTEYLPKYAPDYWELINSDPQYLEACRTASGAIYKFCSGVESGYNITYMGLAIRKDWLDECKLEIPVTLEDWEKVLATFEEKYGAKFSSPKLGFGMASGTGAFADKAATWYIENDKVTFANTKDEYKNYLTTLNKWYNEGWMDPDILTNDSAAIRTKCLNNEVGAMYISSSAFRNILADAEETGAEWIGVPHPVTKEGESVTWIQTRKINLAGKGTMITKSCSEEELIVALKLLNYAYTEEGNMYWNFGDEGVSYTLDANGNPQWTDLITKSEVGTNTAYTYYISSGPCIQSEYIIRMLNPGVAGDAIDQWTYNTDVARNQYMPVLNLTADEGTAYTDKWSAISTEVSANISKFIFGDRSLNEWDDFVATLETMGLAECQKIQQAAYDRWLERVK